ncbi:MAG: pilin, partial [bacterium]|nr:pilin [bacterium]
QKPKQCLNINERISANNLYMDTLLLKEDLEKCKIDESYCTTTKEELQGQIAALTSELAKTVRIMAENEQMINKGETFEVTDMFNPYPRDSEGIPERPVTKRLQTVTDTIATWMITLVSSFAVVALIIGGFMMIISGGDETRLELGKTIFTYSLIGLLVTLLAYGIVSSIQSLFYS